MRERGAGRGAERTRALGGRGRDHDGATLVDSRTGSNRSPHADHFRSRRHHQPAHDGSGHFSYDCRPAPLRPAAAGTYRYDTSGQSTLGGNVTPYPAVTTLVIDAPAGNRQHGIRDLRDPSGNGPVFDSTFEYRADGLYVVNLRAAATLLLFTVVEELAPPVPTLLLPTAARPGYHRELDIPTQTSTAHLVLDVVRQERATVGGQAVDTTVVHLVATLPGQYNARLDLTVWLAPGNGLWVRERVVAEASAGGIPYRSEYDATLQRLSPG